MTYREVDVPLRSRRALDALAVLSKKWHPVVVVTLAHRGPLGFNDLLESIPDVSGKVLSETLEALQDVGIVDRRVVSESPLRVEYDLTDAGRDMEPIFESLGEWGERHLDDSAPRVLFADADRRITEMYSQWVADRYAVDRAHDRAELEARLDDSVDVVFVDAGVPGVDLRTVLSKWGRACRTILLVGDRPAFDLLSVPCDDVFRKPIVRETALEAIDEQLSRRDELADRRELASLEARRSLFESVYALDRLESDERYGDLRERLAALKERRSE